MGGGCLWSPAFVNWLFGSKNMWPVTLQHLSGEKGVLELGTGLPLKLAGVEEVKSSLKITLQRVGSQALGKDIPGPKTERRLLNRFVSQRSKDRIYNCLFSKVLKKKKEKPGVKVGGGVEGEGSLMNQAEVNRSSQGQVLPEPLGDIYLIKWVPFLDSANSVSSSVKQKNKIAYRLGLLGKVNKII